MFKLPIILLILVVVSFALSYFASEYEKQYREPTERKNTRIYPFYELWGYIAVAVVIVLVIGTVINKLKMGP